MTITVWILKLESLTYHCISQGNFEESFDTKVCAGFKETS